jgi:hypothetical protein
MSKWRTIGSAPVNREVLIYDAFYDRVHIAWKNGRRGWETFDEGNDDIGPSHWMELPEPPK